MLPNSIEGAGATDIARHTPPHVRRPKRQRAIKKLSILIPCYNEAGTISLILDKIVEVQLAIGIEMEIIIVDDCSTDDTDLMIQEYMTDSPFVPIHFLQHKTNQGKGAAIRSAVGVATGDYVLIQDADLEYTPADYNRLIEPILSGDADVVYGSRFMGSGPHRILFFWHTLGNKLLTLFNNLCTNLNLTDAHTCYKLIERKTFLSLELQERRFAIDAEINVKIARIQGLKIYEVGISYYGRTFADGKKIRFRDALRTVFCLIKYSVFRISSGKAPLPAAISARILSNL